jgi:hypothetical protein
MPGARTRPGLAVAAALLAVAGGCASLRIELPRRVTLRAGEPAEIAGVLAGNRTPVGGVDVAAGRLPPGLELDFEREAAGFEIRGVPSAPGRYEVGISAWSYGTNFPGDTATAELTIEVVE